jgi:hypothetical protein
VSIDDARTLRAATGKLELYELAASIARGA